MCNICTKIEGLVAIASQAKKPLLELLARIHDQSSYRIGDPVLWELREWNHLRTFLRALPHWRWVARGLTKAVDAKIDTILQQLSTHQVVHKALSWGDTITPSEAISGRETRNLEWEIKHGIPEGKTVHIHRYDNDCPVSYAQWRAKIAVAVENWETACNVAVISGIDKYIDNSLLLDGSLITRPELDVPICVVHSRRTLWKLWKADHAQRISMQSTSCPVGSCACLVVDGNGPCCQYIPIPYTLSAFSDATINIKLRTALQQQSSRPPCVPSASFSENTEYLTERDPPIWLGKMKDHGTLSTMLKTVSFRKRFWFKTAKNSNGEQSVEANDALSRMRREADRRVHGDRMQERGGDGSICSAIASSQALPSYEYQDWEDCDTESSSSSILSTCSSVINLGGVFDIDIDPSYSKHPPSTHPEGCFMLPPSQTKMDIRAAETRRPFTAVTSGPLPKPRFYGEESRATTHGEVRIQIKTSEARSARSSVSDDGPFIEHVIRRGLFTFTAPTTGPPDKLPPLPEDFRSIIPKTIPGPFSAERDFENNRQRRRKNLKCASLSGFPSLTYPSDSNASTTSIERIVFELGRIDNDNGTVRCTGDKEENTAVWSASKERRARRSQASSGRVFTQERYQSDERAKLWLAQE